MPLAWTLDANNEMSDEFSGAQINRRHREKDIATLQFDGEGSYSFRLEGKIPTGADQPTMPWKPIGTYTNADEAQILTLNISIGVQYRLVRTAGTVDVAIQA